MTPSPHIRVGIPVRLHCSHPECQAFFVFEAPIHAISLFATGHVQMGARVEVHPPDGWYLEGHKVALCPDHVAVRPQPAQKAPEALVPGKGTETPPPAVLARAVRLQALAIDSAAPDGERRNAWDQFTKLWKRYNLPNELGLEGLKP